ncbi:copper transporting CPx-type ATPase CtaA [Synechococcus elongatus PCC 6301]|uniref:Probable copper-transporting ATPase SynA n=1 Tax=Synechococcus sp. (strain ATCC 27144 / PCC 6301 / SAUG 1402/1) TaxID=269084 RepID=ATSY_SYNP6|nr:cation-translocating P-type ATPase [Synechococcus elongatus]P07893.2 RecName: Full=Probable copper-transporting ATPase SynA [Synechococcus elongatus PCC 6301]BAD79975.1 copper transporting CPx-type ATPase CtaA [Synechococcus elongatus PCC 6301]
MPAAIVHSADPSSTSILVEVEGMKCAGCVAAVERRLQQTAGVEAVSVNLITRLAKVDYDAALIEDPTVLTTEITGLGFRAQLRQDDNPLTLPIAEIPPLQQQRLQLAIAAFLLIVSSWGHLGHWLDHPLPGTDQLWFHALLAIWALLGPGRSILQAGWQGLRCGAPNMNSLVLLGTGSAYLASLVALLWPQLGWVCFLDEPVMLLGFILLGRTLEEQARFRSQAALQNLLALQPETTQLLTAPSSIAPQDLLEAPAQIWPVAQLRAGDYVQVLPGVRIPVDGCIVAGQSTLDTAMLTGEPLPQPCQVGDRVCAGTLNLSHRLVIRAEQTGSQTRLAAIVRCVAEAQQRKAPVQRFADAIAGRFVYGVCAIAALTFGFWATLGSRWWPQVLQQPLPGLLIHAPHHGMEMAHPHSHSPLLLALTLAISVLVVACPCALGLATPTAILVATGLAAEQGILVRGGDVLEQLARIKHFVFDKTGTLTQGQFELIEIQPLADVDPDRLLQWAAALEADSRHPLATALQTAAQAANLAPIAASDRQQVPGLGVSGTCDGRSLRLGNPTWVQVATAKLPTGSAAATSIWLADDQQLLACFWLQDQPRPEAAEVVQALRSRGATVQILSGDRQTTAVALAQQLGLESETVVAEVLPEDKAAAIAALQSQGDAVAMIGDGINDAPALATAAVGISLAAGSDIAQDSAGLLLSRDRLDSVLVAWNLSQMGLRTIRQNLTWALGYNVVMLPLAAGAFLPAYGLALTPAIAGACMAVSSLAVVSNSLLLRYWFRRSLNHSVSV